MSEPLTEAKFNEVLEDVWAAAGNPSPNTLLVSMTTKKKIDAVIAFNESLRWWRRAFYWVFRAKASRDLWRFVAARVPEEPNIRPPFSGLSAFMAITPELAAEQYEREMRRKR